LGIEMLRSFEQLCQTANPDLLVAADDEYAAVAGGGEYAMPWHWHDCLMFILPSRGTIELKHEAGRAGTWLSQDRFAVVPAGRAHETRAGIGAHSHIALYVTGFILDRLDKEIGSLSEFRRRTRSTILFQRTSKLRALQELSTRPEKAAYGHSRIRHGVSSALLVQCIAEVMTGEAVPGTTHRDHGMMLVDDLKQYLIAHVDQAIPLDALEARFGVSRRHITRLFREFTGSSIGEFQQRIRLEKACELLGTTDLRIGEIAFRVGFDSGTALAHAMRRADGRSPSDIRKRVARPIKN
jgi:AraC family transcriptional regulator